MVRKRKKQKRNVGELSRRSKHARMRRSKGLRLACNKPRAEVRSGHSHVVLACYPGGPEGGKLIRFGQAGVKGSPKKKGESEAYRKRREAFKARHAKNIAKGPSSAAYWADKVKW